MYFEFPTRNIFSKNPFLLCEEERAIANVINIAYQPRYMLYRYFSLVLIIPCMKLSLDEMKTLAQCKQQRVAKPESEARSVLASRVLTLLAHACSPHFALVCLSRNVSYLK